VGNMELFKSNFAKEVLLMKWNSFVYIFKTVQVLFDSKPKESDYAT
jgi:hypothetical protein